MNFFIGLGVLLSLSPMAKAGNPREVIACQNEHYQLILRETAVPTYKEGTLNFSGRSIHMKCQGEFQPNSKNVSFTCEEDRAGDGRYLAGVVLMGAEGNAEIVHEQMYPLQPKSLAKIPCKLDQE
ncbi:hypothetical protein EBR78_00675 [bacterium]|nr:hypothetical protein [bacterium]NBX83843.1 hypothetical protein [bacterium]